MPEGADTEGAWLALGVVGKPHGLAGVVWFHPYNPGTDALREGLEVRLVSPEGSVRSERVVRARPGADGVILRLEGAKDRDAAEALRQFVLQVRRADLPAPAEGEYYHVDLVGLEVFTQDGGRVGWVSAVESYPSVDALVVTTPEGSLELPMTADVVLSVDLASRRITADLAPLNSD